MVWIFFVIFVLIQVFDVYSTVQILKQGGRELNPIMRKLMARFGVILALIISKVIVVGLLCVVVWVWSEFVFVLIMLTVLISIYTFFMYRNYKAMRR
jgi:uncharacterized protein YacL